MDENDDMQVSPLILQESDDINENTNDWKTVLNNISTKGPEQRYILLMVIILSIYFIVLLLYAILSKSTSYIPVAFIQLLHSALLFITIFADFYSTLGPDEHHTYGYARSTIVCSFAISLATILFAFSLLLEALKTFLSDDNIEELPSFSTTGPHFVALLIYASGAFVTRKHVSNPSKSRTPHLHAAFLVFVSGMMHSFAHISSGLVPFMMLPDEVAEQAAPLFHGLVALFIIDRARLLIVPSFLVLMQATPEPLLEVIDPRIGETVIDRMVREASHFEGVLECKSAHFWGLTFTDYIGSLHIRAKNDANEQHIITQAHSKFDPVVTHFTAQVEKDHWDRLGAMPQYEEGM